MTGLPSGAPTTTYHDRSGEPIPPKVVLQLEKIFGEGEIEFVEEPALGAESKTQIGRVIFRTDALHQRLQDSLVLRRLLTPGDRVTPYVLLDQGQAPLSAHSYVNNLIPPVEALDVAPDPVDEKMVLQAEADAADVRIFVPQVADDQIKLLSPLAGKGGVWHDRAGRPRTSGDWAQVAVNALASKFSAGRYAKKLDDMRGDTITAILAPAGRSIDLTFAQRIAQEHHLNMSAVEEDRIRPNEKSPRKVGMAFHTRPFDEALKTSEGDLLRWRLLRSSAMTRQGLARVRAGLSVFVLPSGTEIRREEGQPLERYISERAGPIVVDGKKAAWSVMIEVPKRVGMERAMAPDVVKELLTFDGAEALRQRIVPVTYVEVPGGGTKKVVGAAEEIVMGVGMPALEFRRRLYTDPAFAQYMLKAHDLARGLDRDQNKAAIEAEVNATARLPGRNVDRETWDAKALRKKLETRAAEGLQVTEIDHLSKLHGPTPLPAFVKSIEEKGPDAIIGEEKDLRRTSRRFDPGTFARWVLLVLMLAMMGTGVCAIFQFKGAAEQIKRRRDGDAPPPPAATVERRAPPRAAD